MILSHDTQTARDMPPDLLSPPMSIDYELVVFVKQLLGESIEGLSEEEIEDMSQSIGKLKPPQKAILRALQRDYSKDFISEYDYA